VRTTDPFVSVIIPTKNRESFLQRALRSALLQTYTDFEILVVDDGSSDGTREAVAGFDSPRIRYFYRPSGHAGAARNFAFTCMRGRVAAFLDSDDLWDPRHLETAVDALSKAPAAGMAVTNFRLIDSAGETLNGRYVPASYEYQGSFVSDFLSGKLPVATSGVLVRRETLRDAGRFDERYRTGEDFDLWLRAGLAAPVLYLRDPLVSYRTHSDSVTGEGWSRMWASTAEVLKERRDSIDARRLPSGRFIARFYALAARAAYDESKTSRSRSYSLAALRHDPLCAAAYKGFVRSFIVR